jgi:hypothetical protein
VKPAPFPGLPIKRDLELAYRLSLAVAALMVAASAAGIALGLLGGLYGPKFALGVREAEAGLLVPGLIGQDLFGLVVGVPLLLGTMWLARRGSPVGLLLLPGMLFYALYWYVIYLVGAPFGVLFLAYVSLVTLSAYATIAVVSAMDGEAVRQRLAGTVPARIVGGILVVLALLTFGQDATGALLTALADGAPVNPAARHVWISDLALGAPATLVGGALLWQRRPLGYVAGAGLLLSYGLTPVGLAVSMALRSLLTGSLLDVPTVIALLVFALVSFTPLAFFFRGVEGARAGSRRGAWLRREPVGGKREEGRREDGQRVAIPNGLRSGRSGDGDTVRTGHYGRHSGKGSRAHYRRFERHRKGASRTVRRERLRPRARGAQRSGVGGGLVAVDRAIPRRRHRHSKRPVPVAGAWGDPHHPRTGFHHGGRPGQQRRHPGVRRPAGHRCR